MSNTQQKPEFCLECKHFEYICGEYGWSEVTPGYDATMSCRKDHWEMDMHRDDGTSFREKLRSAATCADFEQDPDVAHLRIKQEEGHE